MILNKMQELSIKEGVTSVQLQSAFLHPNADNDQHQIGLIYGSGHEQQ